VKDLHSYPEALALNHIYQRELSAVLPSQKSAQLIYRPCTERLLLQSREPAHLPMDPVSMAQSDASPYKQCPDPNSSIVHLLQQRSFSGPGRRITAHLSESILRSRQSVATRANLHLDDTARVPSSDLLDISQRLRLFANTSFVRTLEPNNRVTALLNGTAIAQEPAVLVEAAARAQPAFNHSRDTSIDKVRVPDTIIL